LVPAIVRLILLAAAVGAVAAAAAFVLPHDVGALQELATVAGAAAPLAAIAAWVLLTPALFPGAVLAAAGGLAFGAGPGAAVAWVGALLGALAAFGLARGIGRRAAEQLLGDRLARPRALLERRGFAAVLVARLAPGVPATILHYAAALSRVRGRHFTAAIAVGAALRTAPYAVLGAGLGAGSASAVGVAAASIAVGALGAMLVGARLRARPRPAS
jgi:uncharacterized membrane protein YdjX (TVP38/TMEM64 family)